MNQTMPWRYPAAWFIGLMVLGAQNFSHFTNIPGIVIYVTTVAAVSYGLAYLNWRTVSRRKP
jgi:hypothetical protein